MVGIDTESHHPSAGKRQSQVADSFDIGLPCVAESAPQVHVSADLGLQAAAV